MTNFRTALAVLATTCAFILTGCAGKTGPDTSDLAKAQTIAAAYDVTITRDHYGVPHIAGATSADVGFGLGYAVGEDDFATFQETAIAVRGELASHVGIKGAVTDYLVRLMRIWEVVDAKWQTEPSDEARAMAQGYADGINLYAAEHPDEVWAGAYPFTAQDIFAGILFKAPLFFGVEGEVRKVMEGRINVDRTTQTAQPDQSDQAASLNQAIQTPFSNTMGSNAIAVAPKRSADGATRLFVNSHQPFTGPVAWYEAHLTSQDGLEIVGGTFPGFPLIGHGVRPELGWAFTVNKPDLTDVYQLTLNPANKDEYLLDGAYVPFEKSQAKIKVKLMGFLPWTVSREVIWSAHGPALRTDHGVFAIRFPGIDDLRGLDQYIGMNKATTFAQWRDAMRISAVGSFNVVYADKTGMVAHIHNARFPKRKTEPDLDWTGVLPGDRSDLIWQDEYGFDFVPAVIDPKSGLVFSANSTPFDVTDGPDNPDAAQWPAELYVESRYTNRAHRLHETYGTDPSITRDEFIAYKFDLAFSDKSQMADARRAILARDFSGDPLLKRAQAHIMAWDLNTNVENTHTALGVYSMFGMIEAEIKGTPTPDPVEGFIWAAQFLHDKFGRLDIPWGDVNRLRRGDKNVAVNGGPDILRAIYDIDGPEGDGGLKADVGDSYIVLSEWYADGRQDVFTVHQFGVAATRPDATHYADQVEMFAAQKFKRHTFDQIEIKNNATRIYSPGR